MILNSLFIVLWGDFTNTKKSGRKSLNKKMNIKRDKINLFDPYAMGLYCEIKGKIESLTLAWHLPAEIFKFCTNIS